MSSLFKTAACFTDIHYGLKQNSRLHLDDCHRYIDWFIAEAKARNAETCIFLGDWSHHRASVNVATLNASIKDLKKLNDNFEKVYFITGNHDLYYRDKREMNSIEYARDLSNFIMVDDFFEQDDVAIIPWLVGDDHKRISKLNTRYVMGHFELPHFKMNAMVEMPDHGELQAEHFGGVETVFSGHFHMRQTRGNITYMGNAFPHNYADAGDENRGCGILEWGKEIEYHAWPDQPLYNVYKLSQLLDENQKLLKANQHVRVQLDIDISYEEAGYIRDTFINQYNLRDMSLIPIKTQEVGEDLSPGEIKFESVDQIVTDQILNIESDFYDSKLLLQIYQTL